MSLFEPVVSWWNSRESREQKFLLIGGVFAVVAAAYAGLSPAFLKYSAAAAALREADGNYQWLEEQVALLAQIRTQAGGVLPVSLPAEEIKAKLEGDLEKKKLKGAVSIEDAGGARTVRVAIEGGAGGAVMRWIEELVVGGYAVSAFDLQNQRGRLSGVVVIEG